MAVGASKSENLQHAAKLVAEAAKAGAQVVALPEFCTSTATTFADNGEVLAEGESVASFAKMAKDNGVFLVAGSIPEREGDKLYNTCTVFNPEGKMIAKHRKVHLFDIDIPGKFKFQESATISPGHSLNTFDTPFCKIGLGICYDIRFAEMAQVYAKNGCDLLLYPGAFAMTTGPAHWELLARGRALDNQVYVASVSPARDEGSGYVAWGHSLVVNPWGEVIGATDEKENIVYADIDLDYAKEVREQIPIRKQRRDDVYKAGVNDPKL